MKSILSEHSHALKRVVNLKDDKAKKNENVLELRKTVAKTEELIQMMESEAKKPDKGKKIKQRI